MTPQTPQTQQTLRQWLEARVAQGQALTFAESERGKTSLSARTWLDSPATLTAYAGELDGPVEEVTLTELYAASRQVGHIGRTDHLAFVYLTDTDTEQ